MAKQEKIIVQGTEIIFFKKEQEDYISLTDIAKTRDAENPSQIISLWLRTYSTIEYFGLWEMLFNPNFKPHIYEGFKIQSAKPHFWMSAQKWVNETNAIGITSKEWRDQNPDLKGNIRDYATINELICLYNMENINAVLINDGVLQSDRLVKLNQIAIQQIRVLQENSNRKYLN